MRKIVCAVSPHGFGHAARTAAIVEALARRRSELEIEIWTTVPEWFFAESLHAPFELRPWPLDVGLVQSGPTAEDPAATVRELARLWAPGAVSRLATELRRAAPALVLADISPLALEAARRASLPSVLVENFTWDWIYEGYLAGEPRLAPWIAQLHASLDAATLRIQTEPVCRPVEGSVRVGPIARAPRSGVEEVRRRLGIAPGRRMVLVSFGGVPRLFRNLDRWNRIGLEVDFVVPGGAETEERRGDLVLLPHHSPVYHPDLVRAADAVVGKLGYSTVAEIHAARTRVAFVRRPRFRESEVLEQWVSERLPAIEITEEQLDDGTWIDRLPALLEQPRPRSAEVEIPGADAAAGAISDLLDTL